MENTAISLLKPFVATASEPRSFLHFIHRQDGYLYASEGCIIVRVKDDQGLESDLISEKFVPGFKPGNFFPDAARLEMAPMNLPIPPLDKCFTCLGSGRQGANVCDSCEGDGFFIHGPLHTEYECKDCHGKGRTGPETEPCEACDGSGDSASASPVDFGAFTLNAFYLHKLVSLPNIEIQKSDVDIPHAYFRFDGGEGVLAVMRRDWPCPPSAHQRP